MRSRSWRLVRFVAPVGLIPLFACLNPPVESPRTTVTQETNVRVEQNIKNKVDLLFMIDNSPSMAPKQQELRTRFPLFIKALEGFAAAGNKASYHIGVVNSDLGAAGFTLNNGQCHPGGDGAKLQVVSSPSCKASATCTTANIPNNCSGLTLSGGNFLDYNQLANSNNIGGGLSVSDAFSCMAAQGDTGCGFEHQLEATYRALHDSIPENAGFLRSDAILAVVFVTDEDDCSAPTDSNLFDNTAAGVSMYGTLDSFRCTQYGVQCNGSPVPPMSVSGLMNCSSYDLSNGGKLIEQQKYINFFTNAAVQGGVKVNADDVILVGITAPENPVGVTITMPCHDVTSVPSCPTLNHSCTDATNPAFFGDPAVRINGVVKKARHTNLTSICDTDYTAALQALGDLIVSQIGAGCLNAPVANRADGTPDCVVEDVTSTPTGDQIVEIPSCAQNGHVTPCWELVDKLAQYQSEGCTPVGVPPPMTCKLPQSCQPVTNPLDNTTQLVTVNIDRGPGGMPPANTTARVSCATIASSSK